MAKASKKDGKKKEREYFYLEKVKSIAPGFPHGEILQDEEPDFLIINNLDKIGIEVVDYIRGQSASGSKIRHYERVTAQIIQMAKVEFDDQYQIPLSVHFHWHNHQLLHLQDDVKKLPREIVDEIARRIPEDIWGKESINPDYSLSILLQNYILHISITRLKPNAKSLWSNTECGFIDVEQEELQNLISFKEEKIDAYLKKCDSVWLVIIADGKYISSNAELNNSIQQEVFRSRFEKVLFYNASDNHVITLM